MAKQDYKAIATQYRGYEFRSRLEAKYARFFDLCGWKWSYEPLDLNGWIPDFMLGELRTLVEVKPFFEESEYDEAKRKIRESGYTKPVILLGGDPTWIGNNAEAQYMYQNGLQFGWLYESIYSNNEQEWICLELHFGVTEGNDKPGLCPMYGGWTNYIWSAAHVDDHPNKWSRVSMNPQEAEELFARRWAEATNVAKWMPVLERSCK